LRPGSILDLTVIASDSHLTDVAKSFGIPYSTLAAYISGTRFISPSAVWDIGTRWGNYISYSGWDFTEDAEFDEADCIEIFYENFQNEYNLRQIVEPISWQKSFSCCAAQVLARFEAGQTTSNKMDIFDKNDAINLLKTLINGPYSEENHPNMLNLSLRYVLWRVKTREYYKIEQFYPNPRCIEIRDARPIPLVQQIDDKFFLPDHRFYDINKKYPDTPRLKKAATLDVLLLCHSVEVKVDHSRNICQCSCTNYSNDFIYFFANPIATSTSK
ncbi:MAG: hypothetical protein K6T65_15895, partial [Peptococcaceae bacterium]|nr:hypothetical protein [Peptococcaceae bacterium]